MLPARFCFLEVLPTIDFIWKKLLFSGEFLFKFIESNGIMLPSMLPDYFNLEAIMPNFLFKF